MNKTGMILSAVFLVLVVGVFLFMSLPALRSRDELQGVWKREFSDGRGIAGFLEYSFRNGRYELKGYPAISEAGSYSLMKQEGSADEKTFAVEFVPDESVGGSGPSTSTIQKINDSLLKINGESYVRVGK
jgi:hypothetical protein